MRKLTENEIKDLRQYKNKPDGDMLYWEHLDKIYKDDKDALSKIQFLKQYLLGVKSIPFGYASRDKTERTYMDAVDAFNAEIGYTPEEDNTEDCLLEEIAARFGIDIDINGDGKTSFEKYRKMDIFD